MCINLSFNVKTGNPNRENINPDALGSLHITGADEADIHGLFDFFARYVQKVHSDEFIRKTLKMGKGTSVGRSLTCGTRVKTLDTIQSFPVWFLPATCCRYNRSRLKKNLLCRLTLLGLLVRYEPNIPLALHIVSPRPIVRSIVFDRTRSYSYQPPTDYDRILWLSRLINFSCW